MLLRDLIVDELNLGAEASIDGLCVSWSGGLDSTVLLHLLVRVRATVDCELAAVHVDHGLRADSDEDADFCRRLAADWNVPLAIERLDLDDGASQSMARRRRYAAVAEAARRFGLEAVATAHHADDALETALMHFVRGAGSAGLASLAPDAPRSPSPNASWGDLELVRPLLRAERSELEQYADTHDLTWRTDPTNATARYRRNRIRHDVLPDLTEEAGSTDPMHRTLANLADEARALERRVDRLWTSIESVRPSHSAIAWPTDALRDVERAEQALLLRRAGRALPEAPRWDREHLDAAIEAIERVCKTERGERLVLGGAVLWVEPKRTTLELERRRGTKSLDDRRAHPVGLELEEDRRDVPWFETEVSWEIRTPEDPTAFPRRDEAEWFDCAALPDRLELRGPAPGAEIDAFGLGGHKAIADLLREADVSASRRWRWPCLYAPSEEAECLWVCGIRRSERAAVTSSTHRVLAVELESHPSSSDPR